MKYLRVSAVASFFKSPDYIDYLEKTVKRERTLAYKKAVKIGSRVDALIKTSTLPTKEDSQEVTTALQGWTLFLTNYPAYRRSIAARLVDEKLGITGEPDLYFNNNEVSDLKVALAVRFEYWVQLGGYLCLPLPFEPSRASIVRLDKNHCAYEYKVKENVSDLRTLFIGELNKVRAYIEENNYDDTDISIESSDLGVNRPADPETRGIEQVGGPEVPCVWAN